VIPGSADTAVYVRVPPDARHSATASLHNSSGFLHGPRFGSDRGGCGDTVRVLVNLAYPPGSGLRVGRLADPPPARGTAPVVEARIERAPTGNRRPDRGAR
ncbi:hypothetical protein, partial [Streptomyces sp. NPDC097610]|uniref:hypothetical protein n=1 Tax=Streptomyces sp. NPDC097610 TaxID=3157227 RepID=UPI003325CB9A